ncbi:MAG: CNP1-like family protein [Pseudomonadota bacterium]
MRLKKAVDSLRPSLPMNKTVLGNAAAVLLAFALGAGVSAHAQSNEDNPDWKESDVPPAPAFDMGKLLTFSGAVSSSLTYGVDPSTIQISRNDGVVRYVLVAMNDSGAKNVMYEGIRCSTGEFRTYARYSSDGRWNVLSGSEWRTMFGNLPSKHALYLARAGVCDGSGPATSVDIVVRRLKNPNFRYTE